MSVTCSWCYKRTIVPVVQAKEVAANPDSYEAQTLRREQKLAAIRFQNVHVLIVVRRATTGEVAQL